MIIQSTPPLGAFVNNTINKGKNSEFILHFTSKVFTAYKSSLLSDASRCFNLQISENTFRILSFRAPVSVWKRERERERERERKERRRERRQWRSVTLVMWFVHNPPVVSNLAAPLVCVAVGMARQAPSGRQEEIMMKTTSAKLVSLSRICVWPRSN